MTTEKQQIDSKSQVSKSGRFLTAFGKGFVAGFVTLGLISVLILIFRN
ncbi:hypothetical protein [Kangiella sp. HZ709]|nr:hypothetical protein [Kangiella sp. HZ709]MRX26929.1 hypothetical protein [Kangiella sp. HZ709]